MKTSKKIGLRSEASNRFEKKLDPENTINAIGRFEELLSSICNIKTDNTFYDNYADLNRKRSIELRTARLNEFLGTDIKTEKISDETVKRVQQALERSGYIPNMAGILLARNNSRIIGVVVNDNENNPLPACMIQVKIEAPE